MMGIRFSMLVPLLRHDIMFWKAKTGEPIHLFALLTQDCIELDADVTQIEGDARDLSHPSIKFVQSYKLYLLSRDQ